MKNAERPSLVRRIAGDTVLALAVLLSADVVFVMLRRIGAVVMKEDYKTVFIYELILCAILLVFALDLRFNILTRTKKKLLRVIGRILRAAVILFTAVVVFFCGKVILGGLISTADRADHAIVLGMALENGEPTPDLIKRLDTAQAYLEKYPEAKLVLTGGNADGSGRTEADVMRDILTERGVNEERLILEDRAGTTKENFANIARMIPKDEPVVMITSGYHMDRAVRNAAEEGFEHVMRLPAGSGFITYGSNMIWEVIHDLDELFHL